MVNIVVKKITYALIMAAGRGSRMMPLTQNVPKAMAPYDGSTLISQGIKKVKSVVPNIYITVGYKGAVLAQHVIDIGVSGLFDTSGKDNAWWIFNTLMKELDEPVYVLTCDNIIKLDFDLIADEYYSFGSPAAMVVPVKPIEGLEGDYIFHKNNLIKRLSRNEPSDIYCSGIQVINPKKINSLIKPAENFYSIWSSLIEKDQLYCGDIYPDEWFAADTIKQLEMIPKGY